MQLRDQIASPARTVLLVLLAASGLVFIIACSNVANLILARSVRREGELAIRATLGASAWALRRTLLAESLLLCGAGAILGVALARPMVALLARYAARFSVRALELTVDASLLWVGVGLALLAAVLLAFVPRLPSAEGAGGLGSSTGGVRITSGTNRRLRLFAVTQIAASFVLLAGAGMLLTTLFALQAARTTFQTRNVLTLVVPEMSYGRTPDQVIGFYQEAMRRISALPGVERVAVGTQVPWREAGNFGPGFQLSDEGHVRASADDDPRAQFRTVSPGFFAALGVPLLAGRDFNDGDRRDSERVVIISQSLAQQLFPNKDAVNRHLMWTDPVMQFIDMSTDRRRIVGVVGDIDDENVVPGPAMNVYHPHGPGVRRRPPVRPHPHRSVSAGRADHAHHPRPVGRAAGRTGGDARRRAGRGAGAGSAERAGVRRLRRRGAADRGRRRGRRAGVLGERADARVRHPAGDRLGAAPPPDRRAPRRRRDRRGRHRDRRRRRVRPRPARRRLHHGRAPAGSPADSRRGRCCSWPPPSWRR